VLHPGGPHWRSFGETTNQLIEKLLCTDLQVERITAIFDADVEKLFTSNPWSAPHQPAWRRNENETTYRQRQQCDILIPGIDQADNLNGCLSGTVTDKNAPRTCESEFRPATHALPFLELIRSATSRFRARLGS
jgi:hypothetical protein